jgi:hypothetical protein
MISKLYPNSFQLSTRALTSFGKQLPPYPAQAERNVFQILGSSPIHFATSKISAPTCSAKLAISFINDIFVAKKLFAAYFISSELCISVKNNTVLLRSNGL